MSTSISMAAIIASWMTVRPGDSVLIPVDYDVQWMLDVIARLRQMVLVKKCNGRIEAASTRM